MRIIDRYITGSFLKIYLTTILVFCFLYILIDVASNLDELISRKVPLAVLYQYYSSFFPIILTQTSAIACLIATLFVYSHLNYGNEIIALRTSGLNFWKIAKPAICIALLVSAFIFWLNEKHVPEAQAQSERIRNANMIIAGDSRKKTKARITNLTFYGLKNRLYFIDNFDPNTYEIEGITIIGFDSNQNIQEKINAWKGKWTGIIWKFYNCQIAQFGPTDIQTPTSVTFYEEKLMDIKEAPEDFMRQRLNVSSMNIQQLKDYIAKFSNSGAIKAIHNLKVDLYQKFAYPLGTFVIVMVGLPLSMMTRRRKAMTFTSLGIAIGIGFLYYVCDAVGIALGKGGTFPPPLAAWLAPFLFSSLAVFLIKTKVE